MTSTSFDRSSRLDLVAPSLSPLVVNDYDPLEKVLVCPPDHFRLVPINEIARDCIERGEVPDPDRVRREHSELVALLRSTGTEVIWVEPHPNMPYQVFIRDIGLATPQGLLLGRFRFPDRQGEEDVALRALQEHVPEWRRLPDSPPGVFEGGDFVYLGNQQSAVGIGARTDTEGAIHVRDVLAEQGIHVILVPFDPGYLHLDMILTVVSEGVSVLCPELLPQNLVGLLRHHGFELIDVSPDDVNEMKCNVLAVDNGIVISPSNNTDVNERLRALGIEVLEVDLHDLMMGGGGPRCLTFPIRRRSSATIQDDDER